MSQKKIPYINLSIQWQEEKDALLPIIEEVMSNGQYVGGKHIERFEQSVKNLCATKYCVALNSGTDALVCALVACDIKRGDEVITPPNSFIASTAAIVHIGGQPVFADVLPDQTIDPKKIETLITSKTKAIMPVHLTGKMCQMDKILSIAEKYGLSVIEDCAQAIGSMYNGKLSGSLGKVGCFSTHPLKNLNACGDGGFIVTNDKKIAEKIKSIRNHGIIDRNVIEEFGYVSRMDNLQAAILNYRIKKLPKVIKQRRANAHYYCSLLKDTNILLPFEESNQFSTFHTFVIQSNKRNEIIELLKKNNIETAIHYPIPIHLQPASKSLGYKLGDFPVTEEQSRNILTLPVHQYLTKSDIKKISEIVKSVVLK